MEETIKKIMSDLFGISENEITDDTSVDNTKNWDSLKHMELIVSIEEEFDITLSADEIVSLTSFAKVKQKIEEHSVGVH